MRASVSALNFRLCVRNKRKAPCLPNAECHVGSGSISASAPIHGGRARNLQETQHVSMSVYHFTFVWYLLTCVAIFF